MVKTKNILIISAADPYRSAGIVALDLYKGLSTFEGNKVKLITKFCKPQNQNVISFLKPIEHNFERIINKFKKLLIKLKLKENKIKYTNPDYHVLDFDQTNTFFETKQILKKVEFKPSHIIVLFTQNFISFKNIYELNKTTSARIYLYPMDMAHLTGGCHYAWDCSGYKSKCSNCPAIIIQSNKNQSLLNQAFKEGYISKTDLTIFACNEQIKEQIESSAIFKNKNVISEIYPIPDRSIFFPDDKSRCMEYFGIDKNQVVLFFGSVSFDDRRKGMKILQAALFELEKELKKINFDLKKITFLTAGSKYEIQEWPRSHFNFVELGYINDYKTLAKAYNASDFFISPSIEETGPTMVLQSILCETPAITFNLGYTKEFYTAKLRQLISYEKNSSSLMKVILNSLKIDENFKNEFRQINHDLNFNTIIYKINKSLI